jgi:hypothetical protein
MQKKYYVVWGKKRVPKYQPGGEEMLQELELYVGGEGGLKTMYEVPAVMKANEAREAIKRGDPSVRVVVEGGKLVGRRKYKPKKAPEQLLKELGEKYNKPFYLVYVLGADGKTYHYYWYKQKLRERTGLGTMSMREFNVETLLKKGPVVFLVYEAVESGGYMVPGKIIFKKKIP